MNRKTIAAIDVWGNVDDVETVHGIVLCYLPDNTVTPYATWQTDRDGTTFFGHYHRTLAEAWADYRDRCLLEFAIQESQART